MIKDVIFANFAALSYTYFETVKKNRDIKTVMFDDKKKNANKMNVKTNHLFMAYSECSKYETPLWDKLFNNWNYVVSSGKKTNFYGVAFRNAKDVIISFRGTDDTDDIIDDINLGVFSKWTDSIEYAIDFTEKVISQLGTDVNLYFTGHSLGGALAQIVGKIFNAKKIVTFNALGTNIICSGTYAGDILEEIITYHVGVRDTSLLADVLRILSETPDNSGAINGVIEHHYKSNTNSYNIVDKEIGPVKVQIGVNSNIKESKPLVHLSGIGEKIVKYAKYVDRLADNTPESINYIIGGDWTPTCCNHYGTIRVFGDVKHEYKTGFMKFMNTPSFGLHSMGWFLLFMDDDGNLRDSVRSVFIHNILRDVCDINNKVYREKTLHGMLKAVSYGNIDLATNEAILLSEDKKFWKKYRQGVTFRNTMRHSILFRELSNPFVIGGFCNCTIDNIDGKIDPIKISK